MTEFAVPAEFERYADQLDRVAEAMRFYLERPSSWAADSPAAQELAAETSVSPLGFRRPVLATLTRTTQCLGFAHDHLVALSAILRTPRTVYALYTVTRTLLLSAAQCFHLADPSADTRERVRRGMNLQMGAWAETMNLTGSGTSQYDQAVRRRMETMTHGRALNFRVHQPGIKGSFVDPRAWHLGNKPPSDTYLLDQVLVAGPEDHFGQTVFRLLSAFTHAQAHSLLMLVSEWESAPVSSDGVRSVRVGLDEQKILFLLVSIGAVLDLSVRRAADLFGWDQIRWNSAAVPIFVTWGQRNNVLEG